MSHVGPGRRSTGGIGRRQAMTLALAVVSAALLAIVAVAAAQTVKATGFNKAGDILISDQYNNRVIELNKAGTIVWQFGTGSQTPGPDAVVGVNDAQRIPGGRTLIAGTGVPAGTPGYPAGGAADNRVFIVNKDKTIVWQYGTAGVTGSGPNQLNTPVQATYLPNGDVLITDQGNQRVIIVNPNKKIVWQYGKTGVAASGFNRLNSPNSAEALPNGDILIADEANNRVIEVNPATKKIVWHYGRPKNTKLINGAAFASRLPNGDTLISDSSNNRIVEVNMAKQVVWVYRTNKRPGSVKDPLPTRAVRLKNGDTLISDQFNHQVILVNHAKKIVWMYGTIGKSGDTAGLLNGPYDAKVIGDFTGLTAP
jgi:hypothetical protein